jgi:hypothetical protein
MANGFKTFVDNDSKLIKFVQFINNKERKVRQYPLGGAVQAKAYVKPNGSLDSNRITIFRTDQFYPNGSNRLIFRRLRNLFFLNESGQRLTTLGYSQAQIINYVNNLANKKPNEIDFQLNGSLVGSGITVNFANFEGLTVTDGVATVTQAAASNVFTGVVTATSFSGDGSSLTGISAGAGTSLKDSGDTVRVQANTSGAVVTGVLTASSFSGSIPTSQLTGTVATGNLPITSLGGVNFVPGESDTTPAFNLEDATGYKYSNLVGVPTGHQTTINEFQWYQQYASPGTGSSVTGPGITTVNPGFSSNPYYYGTQLKPYQEMTWTHSLSDVGAYWVGIWGGSTTYTPADAGNVALWEKSLVFRNSVSDGHHIDNAGFDYDSTGFSFVNGVTQYTSITNNTSLMRLRYNGDSNKLEIWKGTTPVAIATATVAEDGNPITITSTLSTNAHLPGITTVTYYQDQTKWKYHNSNKSLENSTHDIDQGVVYWSEPLHKGEELTFSIPGNSCHVGVWDGGTGITGSADVRNKANWSTKWQYNHNRTEWEAATSSHGATGVQMAKDIQVDNGTYAIRFDYDTEKLQLWEIDEAGDWLLSSANTGLVGVTTQYIYFSRGGDNTGGGSLPSVTHRSSNYTKVSNLLDAVGPSIQHGTVNNDVWKSNRSLKPGMKLKFTVPEAASNQYWATGYQGSSSQANAYGQGTSTWRLANTERIIAYHNTTRNDSYTAAHDAHANDTYGLGLRNLSWRYNADNTWDLFDEDTDEVILEGDSALDGTGFHPHLLSVTNGSSQDIVYDFQWEWNKKSWFMEYRDWDPTDNQNSWLILSSNGHALQEATANLQYSNGHYSIGNALYNVTWGEKMRPGQEFVWTQLNQNQNGSTKNNMIIGVLDSTYRTYTCGVKFWRVGFLKDTADQDAGFTKVGAASTTTPTAGTSMRLQYEYGTNKLVCYSLNAGVRTKLAESTSALDGNPIFISMGGDSTRLPVTSGVEYYGWEFAHTPTNYYNPWNNWRIGSFPMNVVGLTTGNHATAFTIPQDTVLRHKDGLAQGYQMKWTTATSSDGNPNIGQWKTSNATSGITDVDNTIYWDWRFQTGGDEDIDGPDMVGMTINTSNSNYVGGSDLEWQDPNAGTTQIGYRYHTNNTIDLYDFSNSEIIATVNDTQDGNPVYISWGASNADIASAAQLSDDFFTGGDVGIALTTN